MENKNEHKVGLKKVHSERNRNFQYLTFFIQFQHSYWQALPYRS